MIWQSHVFFLADNVLESRSSDGHERVKMYSSLYSLLVGMRFRRHYPFLRMAVALSFERFLYISYNIAHWVLIIYQLYL